MLQVEGTTIAKTLRQDKQAGGGGVGGKEEGVEVVRGGVVTQGCRL